MSYSFRQTADGGEYKSHITGMTHAYTHDRAGKNKRAALADLRGAEKQFRDAASAREPAPKITREQSIITKPRSEKLADVQHIGRTEAPIDSAVDRRVAQLQRGLQSVHEADRVKAQRRLDAMETARAKGAAREEARTARQAQIDSPEYKAAEQDATDVFRGLSMRADVNQSYVDQARANLNQLRHSKNVAEYETSKQQLEQRFEFERQSKIAEQTNALAQTRENIKGFREVPGVTSAAE